MPADPTPHVRRPPRLTAEERGRRRGGFSPVMAGEVSQWESFVSAARDQADGTIDADPRSLLDADGSSPADADLYHAQMRGMDDEIVTEMWLPRPEPVVKLPIRPSLRSMLTEQEPSSTLNVARYVCQGAHVTLSFDAAITLPPRELLPNAALGRPLRICFLRYRRRI